MTKILLAGANGFIGTFLYGKLKSKFSLTGLDYSEESNLENYYSTDLTDISNVQAFVEDSPHFDALIFLVGLAHKKGKGKDLPEFKEVNYQTLINLLSAFEDNNKVPDKIIFASTISVYGEKYHQCIYGEDSDQKPFSPYALTKLEAEQYLLKNFENKSWILRFAPVYSSDFLLNINRRTKAGGLFYRVGKGNKTLSLCNIKNIKTAVDGIIQGKVPPGVYNSSDPKEYTYNDLLTWSNAIRVIRIPQFAVKMLYHMGKLFNNTFLKENTVKLITDNVFPSDKIRKYISLSGGLNTLSTNKNQQDEQKHL